MGVVGLPFDQILYYQLVQRNIDYLATFDGDGDGTLTLADLDAAPPEIRGQLVAGDAIIPAIDADGDGAIHLEREVRPFLTQASGFDDYPDLAIPDLPDLIRSVEANGTVTERLPAFDGPVLLMNGRNDFQTTAENAEVADAALADAGHPDHTLLLYDGLGHTFNPTGLYEGAFGPPERRVLDDLTAWLRDRAGLD